MLRKNVYSVEKQSVVAHAGIGQIEFVRPFAADDFETALSFIDYVEIPPGHSIGLHRHGENEEVYFIVAGQGTMTVNNSRAKVIAGDLIVNRRRWSHGLENDSDQSLKVLVWETAYVG